MRYAMRFLIMTSAAGLLCVLTTSARADNTLFISSFYTNELLSYDATDINNPTGENVVLSGYAPEGLAGVNGLPGSPPSVLFAANITTDTIMTLNASAPGDPLINPDFINVASAGLAVSPNGQYLYVAGYADGEVYMYSTVTGALLSSASLPGAHDVTVGPDGSVYAAVYNNDSGVIKFSANLTNPTQFIAPGANGLISPAGMTFDSAGNFWVSNFAYGTSMVQEYSATGVLLNTVTSMMSNPLGLTTGPDGNIYVADFGGGDILQINDTTAAVSEYIPYPGVGSNPKYAYFTSNFATYSTVPEPSSVILLGLGIATAGTTVRLRVRLRGVRLCL